MPFLIPRKGILKTNNYQKNEEQIGVGILSEEETQLANNHIKKRIKNGTTTLENNSALPTTLKDLHVV